MNGRVRSKPPIWLLRVLLVDDCQQYLSATARYLTVFSWIRVVGQAASAAEAVQLTNELSPDLILLDIMMPDANGISVIHALKNREDPPLVVMVSLHNDSEYHHHAREAGADGYITKTELQTDLPQLLETLYNNKSRLTAISALPDWSLPAEDQAARKLQLVQFTALFENSPQGITLIDHQGVIREINPSGRAMFGIDQTINLIGQPLAQLVAPVYCAQIEAWFDTVREGQSSYTEFEILHSDSQRSWIETHAIPIVCPVSGDGLILCISLDASNRKRVEDQLVFLTNYDSLTGLPNRMLFADRLHQAIVDAKRHHRSICVVFLDIDRFTNIADTLGQNVGDNLIKAVALRLATAVRPGDTIARFGGDEFAILLHDMDKPGDATVVAQRITDLFTQYFEINGREIYISASLGATLYPDDCPDASAESLIGNAEIALFRAKDVGRSTCMFYDESMTQRVHEDMAIENALRHAMERSELAPYYQPIVDLHTGQIRGLEVLLRWCNHELGTVSPARFIPIAEESGLIIPIGKWVLQAACEQLRIWHDEGYTDLYVSVNISSRQFRDPDLTPCIQQIVAETGLEGRHLELELTESVLFSSSPLVTQCIKDLNASGISFAIDDFGTGYSSLGYLKRFPINKLKIDRSFVNNITTVTEDAAIVRAIITMADNLGIEVTAEGVEEPKQLAFLLDHGCHNMQGYLFSCALPAEDIRQMLVDEKRLSVGYRAPL